MPSTYYELLNVTENASIDEIQAAYRRKAKEYHPDVNEHPEATKLFKQFKTAYETLCHRKKRQIYDNTTHDEYVDQYGGYSSEDLEQTTKVQLMRRHEEADYNNEPDSEDNFDLSQSKNTKQSENKSKFNWILQGRTSESGGTLIYVLRIIIYCTLVYIGVYASIPLYGDENAVVSHFVGFLLILLTTRLIYLTAFEYLRKEYEKIDENSEPDAYALPHSIGIGFFGLLIPTLFEAGFISILPESIIGIIFIVGLYGYLGTVLAVGWGVADDYYNLGYEINPIKWNFAVQTPVLIGLAIIQSGGPDTLLPISIFAPFIIAMIYLYIYHSEIVSEFRWRIHNQTLFSK